MRKDTSNAQGKYRRKSCSDLLAAMKNADSCSEKLKARIAKDAAALACELSGWSEDAYELYNAIKLLGNSEQVQKQLVSVANDFVASYTMESVDLKKAEFFYNEMKTIDNQKKFAIKESCAATYLMYRYAKCGIIKEASAIYYELKELILSCKDNKYWDKGWIARAMNALVSSYVGNLPIYDDDIVKAHKVFSEMKSIPYDDDGEVLEECCNAACLLASVYAQNGKNEEALKLYNEAKNMGFTHDDMPLEARESCCYYHISSGALDNARIIVDSLPWETQDEDNDDTLAKRRMAVKLTIAYCKAGRHDDRTQLYKLIKKSLGHVRIRAMDALREYCLGSKRHAICAPACAGRNKIP